MDTKLNIAPQTMVSGTFYDLLNGAFSSLSGPVGFTPKQPRINVDRIELTNIGSQVVQVYLYKGPSGGHAAGDQILSATVPSDATIVFDVDLVLDAGDFLTGTSHSNGTTVINIAARIGF